MLAFPTQSRTPYRTPVLLRSSPLPPPTRQTTQPSSFEREPESSGSSRGLLSPAAYLVRVLILILILVLLSPAPFTSYLRPQNTHFPLPNTLITLVHTRQHIAQLRPLRHLHELPISLPPILRLSRLPYPVLPPCSKLSSLSIVSFAASY